MCLEPVGDDVWLLWTRTSGRDADVYGAKVRADVTTGIAVSGLEAEPAAGGVQPVQPAVPARHAKRIVPMRSFVKAKGVKA